MFTTDNGAPANNAPAEVDTQSQEQAVDFASMSDDEILAFDPSKLTSEIVNKALAGGNENNDDVPPQEEEEQNPEEVQPEENNEEQQPQENQPEVSYEDFYAALTAPIKAGGTEIQLKDPKDIIRLVQMGVDYSRKMEALNKEAPIVQALKDAGLFTADNVNLAIDVIKGNPDAIRSLAQKHKVGVEELLEDETPQEYTPSNHVPDAQIVAFKAVLQDVEKMEGGADFIDSVNNAFDDEAKIILMNNPQYLTELYNYKQTGVYDNIMKEMTKRQIIKDPSIQGLNSMQAFVRIGDLLYGNTGQHASAQVEEQAQGKQPSQPVASRPASNTNRNSAPKVPAGVATPKSVESVPEKKLPITDFSQYSDEEILKMEHLFR